MTDGWHRSIILTIVVSLTAGFGTAAWADKGSGGGGGSGGGSGTGGGTSGSGGNSGHGGSDGSSPSGHSGRSSGSGPAGSNSGTSTKGGDDGPEGRDDAGHADGTTKTHVYNGGWQERIRGGRYQVLDPAGRSVIDRNATTRDLARFRK